MGRILSSWLMRMERQFIANSIIRYVLPFGATDKRLPPPTSSSCGLGKGANHQGFSSLPRPSTPKDEKYWSPWLECESFVVCHLFTGSVRRTVCSFLLMWPEGKATQLLSIVKLPSPSGPRALCHTYLGKRFFCAGFLVQAGAHWNSFLPGEGRSKVFIWAQK